MSGRNSEDELDQLIRDIIGSVGGEHLTDSRTHEYLLATLGRLKVELSHQDLIPRRIFGKLWFLFFNVFHEAEHARDPTLVLKRWREIQEAIRDIFGPVVTPQPLTYRCPGCGEELAMTTMAVRRHFASAHSRSLSPGEALRLITPKAVTPELGESAGARHLQGGRPESNRRKF